MKKAVFFNVLLVSGFLGILSGCGCYYGNGHIVSEERSVTAFDGIVLKGVGNVYIRPADDYKVVVTTDSNLQHKVITEVTGANLRIDEKPGFGSVMEMTVDVYMPARKSINIKSTGVGDIDAQNYEVENAYVEISGVGDTKIWATKSLTGKISGVGNIYYEGEPAIDVDRKGIGKLKKL